jgi:hydroxymethylpyrimidine pyrophosphatase-like HAD family hydrolase
MSQNHENRPEIIEIDRDDKIDNSVELLRKAYDNSELRGMYQEKKSKQEPFYALFADIDNTFYRSDRAESSKRLAEECHDQNFPVICDTGNYFGRVKSRVDSQELPKFQAVASSVGTEIWVLQKSGEYVRDENYREMLLKKGFNRTNVAQTALDIISKTPKETELEFQWPEAEETFLQTGKEMEGQEFKVSLFFRGNNMSQVESIVESFEKHFPAFRIVVCEDIGDAKGNKYCLDILAATKADAVNYLADITGIEGGIVAGDSGNDTDMLLDSNSDIEGVLVGGYKPEAWHTLKKKFADKRLGSFHTVANDEGQEKKVYIERNAKLLGPDSIRRAANILLRAMRIKSKKEKE